MRCKVFPYDLHFSHGKDTMINLVQILAKTSVQVQCKATSRAAPVQSAEATVTQFAQEQWAAARPLPLV